jgi:hypothetical protein
VTSFVVVLDLTIVNIVLPSGWRRNALVRVAAPLTRRRFLRMSIPNECG